MYLMRIPTTMQGETSSPGSSMNMMREHLREIYGATAEAHNFVSIHVRT